MPAFGEQDVPAVSPKNPENPKTCFDTYRFRWYTLVRIQNNSEF